MSLMIGGGSDEYDMTLTHPDSPARALLRDALTGIPPAIILVRATESNDTASSF